MFYIIRVAMMWHFRLFVKGEVTGSPDSNAIKTEEQILIFYLVNWMVGLMLQSEAKKGADYLSRKPSNLRLRRRLREAR